MKKTARFLVMLLLLVVTCVTGIPVKAEEATPSTEDNLNLDVIYVIDGSGSMERADPEYMAPTAGKLFTELCASSAEGTRAGYVYYSHVILDSVGLTDLSTGKDTLKKGMEAIKYDINNDTDIALGLTEAVKLLKEGKAFNLRTKSDGRSAQRRKNRSSKRTTYSRRIPERTEQDSQRGSISEPSGIYHRTEL